MELLSGIGAANALMKNAASFVRALKEPKVTDEAFSEILKSRLEAASGPEAREAKAAELGRRFVQLRDTDGDGLLRFDESGLDRAAFDRLDLNGDGRLSAEEYQQALLNGPGGSTG